MTGCKNIATASTGWQPFSQCRNEHSCAGAAAAGVNFVIDGEK